MSNLDYQKYKEESVVGRYVTYNHLQESWIGKIDASFIEEIGKSVNGLPIFSIQLGVGPKRILMWSQMHGNESTTTKAVLDLINYLLSSDEIAESILSQCTLTIIPMLNPDGAKSYTRVNANQVDLNRDAQERTQPESKVLRAQFESFNPHYCFNLHDQRTLFSAGVNAKSATVSFLSPSNNAERTVDVTRSTAMRLIVAMNKVLQELIPGQVGRYDDAFNANCVGDAFQMLGVPTLLFEAGHFPGDYQREETRRLIFIALHQALITIGNNKVQDHAVEDYLAIPENEKRFYDVVVCNATEVNAKIPEDHKLGIRFVEELENDTLIFRPEVVDVGDLDGHFGHQTLDCKTEADLELLRSKKLLPLVVGIQE